MSAAPSLPVKNNRLILRIMKAKPYLLTYIFALLTGVLLLVFTGHTDLFRWMVIVVGILLVLPSLVLVIDGLVPRKNPDGTKIQKPWYIVMLGVAGIVVGVVLLCLPAFFAAYIVYTLGVLLILFGLVQIVYTSVASSLVGTNRWFYLPPWLTLIAGIVVVCLGPRIVENAITIITGIFLIVYSVNGLMQMNDNRRRIHRRETESD